MDDQTIRMDLQWLSGPDKGSGGAKQIRKDLADVKVGLKEVESATYDLAGATQAAGGYELVPSALDHVATAAPKAVAGLKAVTVAQEQATVSAKAMAAANQQMAAASALSSQRLTGLSYAFNDFFGAGGGLGQKITSVANNMPMLLAGFGGIGLAASALLPILGALITNWDLVSKALGLAGKEADITKDALTRLSERVDELSKKELKLVVDSKELDAAKIKLDQLKKDQAAWDARLERRTKVEKEAGSGVKAAIDESGMAARLFDVVKAAIENRMKKEAKPISDADIEEQASAFIESTRGMQAAGSAEQRGRRASKVKELQERRRRILDNISRDAQRDAANLIREAESGKGAQIEELAGGLEAHAPGLPDAEKIRGVAAKLRRTTPAAVEAEKHDKVLEDIEKDMFNGHKTALKTEEQQRIAHNKIIEDMDKEVWQATVDHDNIIKQMDADHFAAQKAARMARRPGEAAEGRRLKAAQAELERGPFDEQATARAAELQAQVGGVDAFGKPLTAEGAREQLEKELRGPLKKKFGALPAAMMATDIAGKAMGQVSRQKDDLMARNVDETVANQQIIAETQAALMMELARVGQNVRAVRNQLLRDQQRLRADATAIDGRGH